MEIHLPRPWEASEGWGCAKEKQLLLSQIIRSSPRLCNLGKFSWTKYNMYFFSTGTSWNASDCKDVQMIWKRTYGDSRWIILCFFTILTLVAIKPSFLGQLWSRRVWTDGNCSFFFEPGYFLGRILKDMSPVLKSPGPATGWAVLWSGPGCRHHWCWFCCCCNPAARCCCCCAVASRAGEGAAQGGGGDREEAGGEGGKGGGGGGWC